ncbi:MAG: ribosome small subunit-dependent GTPase A [Thermoanaerobaculales bacterium]|nr:ribosome small subunit-dependent GTPase A [Thermoanaerobaculales bacterium]
MNLEGLGWSRRFQSLYIPFDREHHEPGRVVRVDRGLVTTETRQGPTTAVVPGRLDPDGETGPPAVGDWVVLDHAADTIVVRAILPRRSALARRRPGAPDAAQAVAANLDLVLVIESVERGPNPRRIERAVALAWDGGATPVVVLTKTDLADDLAGAIDRANEGAPFIDVVALSAATDDGVDELRKRLGPGTTAVMLGPSGVGKSTLANRLLGEDRFAVAEVRAIDGRGRHTTTRRELVALPCGGCLVDTPGVRELGLWLGAEAVGTAFPEIEAAGRRCRFRDCRHLSEPGCAVAAEVEAGRIDAARLASYHRLQREAERLEERLDPSRRHELRSRERSFSRLIRRTLEVKNR